MAKLHLIMPMAGAGSRFAREGFALPKPLIEIEGKPFFWWATRSIEKFVPEADIIFVVLREHIEEFAIDKRIEEVFPGSTIVVVDSSEVSAGPVMTCLAGLRGVDDDAPVLFNDCDHLFRCDAFNTAANSCLLDCDGALLTFSSSKDCYSYVQYDKGRVVGTVEKRVVSNSAICGAYLARDAGMFREMATMYLENCAYDELFVSGVYNEMCLRGLNVKSFETDFHLAFGTPEEYLVVKGSPYFEELR